MANGCMMLHISFFIFSTFFAIAFYYAYVYWYNIQVEKWIMFFIFNISFSMLLLFCIAACYLLIGYFMYERKN